MLFRETPWGQQSPPPWSFPGTMLRGFALPASFDKLAGWCEAMLDGVGDSTFFPAFPVVFVYVAHYPKMVADAWQDLGFSVQNEYFFMFPVIRSFGGLFPLELGWTFPFMGVDNGTSAISGEMVVGLPKTLGRIYTDDTANGDYSAAVSMLALETHSKTSQQDVHRLFAVRADTPDLATSAATHGFPSGGLQVPVIDALVPPAVRDLMELPLASVDELAGGCFALRQVRDCGAPTEARLIDIVRMRFQSSNERDFRVWRNAEIDVFDNATFPITDTLGLTGGVPQSTGGIRYTPMAAWGVTLDLSMSAATIA
ncbi:acetoacetate decarboxylase family protein [Sphingomonas sp. SUN019]|uniref:acetoacetate decarboxylase family protein n=1 Tax=Sphingomonas sp. SUN019 TaxID=2937788 RepID=UPI002164BE17|nr:acetoacetate decarboxylase family protein [Sphingomonas sp. SUN019]UVO51741.1 acetoacetate decarboxylase family protein [Sphingomonas sp. SUN019]